jgi:hypothetical protein
MPCLPPRLRTQPHQESPAVVGGRRPYPGLSPIGRVLAYAPAEVASPGFTRLPLQALCPGSPATRAGSRSHEREDVFRRGTAMSPPHYGKHFSVRDGYEPCAVGERGQAENLADVAFQDVEPRGVPSTS